MCKKNSQIYNFKIDFKTAGIDFLDLNFDIKIAIYRLVQEGLNNMAKHAQATMANIRMVYSYPNIILRIEDNGIGFDSDKLMETVNKKGCMGIWSMKERVTLLNGRMNIESKRLSQKSRERINPEETDSKHNKTIPIFVTAFPSYNFLIVQRLFFLVRQKIRHGKNTVKWIFGIDLYKLNA
ncbi:sensor histidine kinase [Desulfocicer niacini]